MPRFLVLTQLNPNDQPLRITNGRGLPHGKQRGNAEMNQGESDSFLFLKQFWPDLHELGLKAERVGSVEPDIAAIRLRSFTEAMVEKLEAPLEIAFDINARQFDKLRQIEETRLLDRRLLAKFHTIRKLGNNAAHNKAVDPNLIEALIDDAWSLATWFCRFMRPEIEWLIPPRSKADGANAAPTAMDASAPAAEFNGVLKFPDDRARRIRDEVARAMAQVDPRARQLRTQISLKDAFTEKLTDDQNACLDALEAFFANQEQRIFLLKGYAGTGKTFLAKGLTEYLSAQGRDFKLGAPTGRAAKNISEKTGQTARTLHSLIYNFSDLKEFSDDENRDDETFKFYADVKVNDDQANAVYIIDEASLISDVYAENEFFRSGTGYLLQDLLTYIGFENSENDRKIILIGDPAQLPPVNMKQSPALDAKYLLDRFGRRSTEYELKEVLRQKADSGVLRNVLPLRESIAKGVFNSLHISFDDDVQHIHADEVVPVYMAARAMSATDLPIIVTHSNSEAADFNGAIRTAIFPGFDHVTPGDRLIITANTSVGERFLANGEFVLVEDVQSTTEQRIVASRNRAPETLTFRDIEISVANADGDATLLLVKILDDFLHNKDASLSSARQRALYVDFKNRHPDLNPRKDKKNFTQVLRNDPYFTALRAKFGYAVTCHKAQGGEWSHVIVSCRKDGEPRNPDNFRWLYTAMTRSSDKLYLLNPPEVRIKTVESANPEESEAFHRDVRSKVDDLLKGTEIEIEHIDHNNYQEAFYLRLGDETARANISYNGKYKIGAITLPYSNPLSDQLRMVLAPLIGQTATRDADTQTSPSRPFLKKFHDQLLPLMDARQIRVASPKEYAYHQRYSFARGDHFTEVNIYYDGKDRLTRCAPLNAERLSASARDLLTEVLEVITSEIIP
jgi:hypothetical protein